MLKSQFIHHKGNKLHYVQAGAGKHPLIFFHGFGQDHTIYTPIIQTLSKDYELFVFDLYFHGKSIWNNDQNPLEKEEWKVTFTIFLQQHQLKTFSLVGFSLGGKFAMATLEAFPDMVKKIFLIAPDGIKTSFWYSMATYPSLLRSFFKGMITNYGRFAALANTMNRLKLVDKGLVRFADFQMGSEEKRKRVYFSWVVFRHLTFNLKKIAGLINAHQIETTVIVGRYDKVIIPENMNVFLKQLNSVRFEILESGHNGLIYQSLPFIQMEK